jgi:hypothetical protein
MFNDIANIPILSVKKEKENIVPRPKYTKSQAMRNVYKAKVNNITKKRGK